MPAKSKSQEHFFSMVRALQKGELDTSKVPANIRKKIRKVADTMSAAEVDDFADTPTKDLPEYASKSRREDRPWEDIKLREMTFTDFLVAQRVIMEEWSTDYQVPASKKGMFDGMTVGDLRAELASLKKSGPHKKGSPEYTREKELEFAIRAKTGWDK